MDKLTLDDKVFLDSCELLISHDINFWVCHGTLLGIIREDRILPWDHDIDFAVWESEVTKDKIIDIFTKAGYKQEIVFGDMDCLHFHGENKKIDVSFYKVSDNIASIKWAAPSNSKLLNIFFYCVQIIWSGSYSNVSFSKNISKKIVQVVLCVLLLSMSYFFTRRLKNRIYTYSTRFMKYTGYSYPLALMKLKKINYRKFLIPVPVESEKCLEHTYGKEWKVPKKDYVWHEEASNLF